jgi:hypothetical protein
MSRKSKKIRVFAYHYYMLKRMIEIQIAGTDTCTPDMVKDFFYQASKSSDAKYKNTSYYSPKELRDEVAYNIAEKYRKYLLVELEELLFTEEFLNEALSHLTLFKSLKDWKYFVAGFTGGNEDIISIFLEVELGVEFGRLPYSRRIEIKERSYQMVECFHRHYLLSNNAIAAGSDFLIRPIEEEEISIIENLEHNYRHPLMYEPRNSKLEILRKNSNTIFVFYRNSIQSSLSAIPITFKALTLLKQGKLADFQLMSEHVLSEEQIAKSKSKQHVLLIIGGKPNALTHFHPFMDVIVSTALKRQISTSDINLYMVTKDYCAIASIYGFDPINTYEELIPQPFLSIRRVSIVRTTLGKLLDRVKELDYHLLS